MSCRSYSSGGRGGGNKCGGSGRGRWVHIFPHCWGRLGAEERRVLNLPIMNLLSRDWHNKHQLERPNIIQALLEAFAKCNHSPRINSDVLTFLAKQFSSWHIVTNLLEKRIHMQPLEVNSLTGERTISSVVAPECKALCLLYEKLSEHDVLHGLWNRRAKSEYSRAALALGQFGSWGSAQDMFYKALSKNQRQMHDDDGE